MEGKEEEEVFSLFSYIKGNGDLNPLEEKEEVRDVELICWCVLDEMSRRALKELLERYWRIIKELLNIWGELLS